MSMRTVINASTKESLGDMDEQTLGRYIPDFFKVPIALPPANECAHKDWGIDGIGRDVFNDCGEELPPPVHSGAPHAPTFSEIPPDRVKVSCACGWNAVGGSTWEMVQAHSQHFFQSPFVETEAALDTDDDADLREDRLREDLDLPPRRLEKEASLQASDSVRTYPLPVGAKAIRYDRKRDQYVDADLEAEAAESRSPRRAAPAEQMPREAMIAPASRDDGLISVADDAETPGASPTVDGAEGSIGAFQTHSYEDDCQPPHVRPSAEYMRMVDGIGSKHGSPQPDMELTGKKRKRSKKGGKR